MFVFHFSFNFQLFPFVTRVYEFKIILERVVDHSAKLQPMGSRHCHMVYTLFLYKNVVFPAQAEYSYFSADFRLKIFLYYS